MIPEARLLLQLLQIITGRADPDYVLRQIAPAAAKRLATRLFINSRGILNVRIPDSGWEALLIRFLLNDYWFDAMRKFLYDQA